MSDTTDRILLGQIASAHGVRGELLVRSFTQAPEDVAAYGALSDEAGTRQFKLKVVRVTPKGVIARIAGVDDRTAAEAMRGTQLYVDRARLPETDDEEFYLSDLVGLRAIAPDGNEVGKVLAVHNFGAGDIIEVQLAGSRKTEMMPFTREFVPDIDLAKGELTVLLPQSSGADTDDETPV